jgi:hypothetical protein
MAQSGLHLVPQIQPHESWKLHITGDGDEPNKWRLTCPNPVCGAPNQQSSVSGPMAAKFPNRAYFGCDECGLWGLLDQKAPSKPSAKAAAKAADKKREAAQGSVSRPPPAKLMRLSDQAAQMDIIAVAEMLEAQALQLQNKARLFRECAARTATGFQ